MTEPGKPVARLLDLHTCPVASPTPHGGGPITGPGAPTVIAGSQPTARLGDLATCPNVPDVIAMGASSVLINGMPAARLLDTTAHGGLIGTGLPSVLIGGPSFCARPVSFVEDGADLVAQYGNSILVRPLASDPDYQALVIAALIRLDTTNNMRTAIDALEATSHKISIQQYVPPKGWGPYNAYCQPYDSAGAQSSTGSSSVVAWDPKIHGFGPPGTTPDSEQPGSDVILAHEMIHGVHNAVGEQPSAPLNSDRINVGEERNTVGLPQQTYDRPGDPLHGSELADTSEGPYTENGVRSEYARRGVRSPVTDKPIEFRSTYYTDGGPF